MDCAQRIVAPITNTGRFYRFPALVMGLMVGLSSAAFAQADQTPAPTPIPPTLTTAPASAALQPVVNTNAAATVAPKTNLATALGNSPAPPAAGANNPAPASTATPAPVEQAPAGAQTPGNADAAELEALSKALEQSLEKIEDKKPPEQQAYENALKSAFPLSPDQIKEVMRRMSASQKAASPPPDPDPQAEVKVENISLEPGSPPPTIRVAIGYVTTVTILDVTGQPWPVENVVVGGNFQIPGPTSGHVIRIIPQTRFGKGNLSISLQGLPTPLTFKVESGKDTVYYRYDVRVPSAGPAAATPLMNKGGITDVAGKDDGLIAVLSGLPPKAAKAMTVSGTDKRTKVWEINDHYYVRTPLTLLSPAWDSSMRSADGTQVYVLPETPVLLMSDSGQLMRVKIVKPPEDNFKNDEIAKGELIMNASEVTGGGAVPGVAGNTIPLSSSLSGKNMTANAKTGIQKGGSKGGGNGNPSTTDTGNANTSQDLQNILDQSQGDAIAQTSPVQVKRSGK